MFAPTILVFRACKWLLREPDFRVSSRNAANGPLAELVEVNGPRL